MRISRYLLLIVLLCAFSSSYAGFVTSRYAVAKVAQADETPATDSVKRIKSRAETFQEGYPYTFQGNHRHRERKANNGQGGGGLAIAALVCACVFEWPFAIIFGAIGMRKGRKNSGIAKGAFIAGLVEGVVYIALVVLASTVFFI